MDSKVSGLDVQFLSPLIRQETANMTITFNFSHIEGATAPPSYPTFNLSVVVSEEDLRGMVNYTLLDTLKVFTTEEMDLNFVMSVGNLVSVNETIAVELLVEYCLDVSYLCVQMTASDVANYIEVDQTNNFECVAVTDILNCQPGILDILYVVHHITLPTQSRRELKINSL